MFQEKRVEQFIISRTLNSSIFLRFFFKSVLTRFNSETSILAPFSVFIKIFLFNVSIYVQCLGVVKCTLFNATHLDAWLSRERGDGFGVWTWIQDTVDIWSVNVPSLKL